MSLEQTARLAALLATRPFGGTVEQRRQWYEDAGDRLPMPQGIHTERAEVRPGLSGLWVWDERCSPDHAILYLHGGAFVIGSSNSYRAFAAAIAQSSQARVFVPDYRRFPEAPFPAAAEDTLACLDWLEGNGLPAGRTGIAGDSAGGHLAAGAIQARLEAGRDIPAAAWLISPYLDLTHSGGSIATRADLDKFIDARSIGGATVYLAGEDPRDPRCSPLFGRAEGFPPTLIQVGSDEVLFDDALRFAEKLRAEGGHVIFQEWVGMLHVFPYFLGHVDAAAHATAQAGVFFQRHLLRR